MLCARALDESLYAHTTMAPHDGHVYEEMRHLAQLTYGLNLLDVRLYAQPHTHTLDVLMIMRRLNVFTQHYAYNLNMQCFVERTSIGKNVNTLSVNHATQSIRTHGIGIINTTVCCNFTIVLHI